MRSHGAVVDGHHGGGQRVPRLQPERGSTAKLSKPV
jgi:hypothetical protein